MKQRSFEDSIGISFVLIDADLLLIWMNKFQLWFCFRRELCPVLPVQDPEFLKVRPGLFRNRTRTLFWRHVMMQLAQGQKGMHVVN